MSEDKTTRWLDNIIWNNDEDPVISSNSDNIESYEIKLDTEPKVDSIVLSLDDFMEIYEELKRRKEDE